MPTHTTHTTPTATTADELETIIQTANRAADEWRRTNAIVRAGALIAIADALDGAADDLVPVAMRETHLPEQRLRGELTRTTFQLRIFADVITAGEYLDARIDHADPHWPMGAPRPDLRRMRIPLGPVVVFAASNFPFAFSVAGGDTASALAAGCSVVLKGHSGHPELSAETACVVVAALRSVGAPSGLFALIVGTESGRLALEHPLVKAGAFTGSIPAGRALFTIATSRPEPIPFYGELGSVNPVFVTEAGAQRDDLVSGFIGSFTAGSGQFCTKPGVLVVPRSANIPARLVESALPPAAALLNPRIQAGYVSELRALAQHPAIEVMRQDAEGWLADPPTPTVLRADIASALADPDALVVEVFGPTALVIEYDREEEMIDLCSRLSGQLTVTVWASPEDASAPDLLDTAAQRAGRVLWNEWPTGVSVTHAQQHGGPYPATTAVGSTSVGTAAIERFLRPVAYQGVPEVLLPVELQEGNPLKLNRRVDGVLMIG